MKEEADEKAKVAKKKKKEREKLEKQEKAKAQRDAQTRGEVWSEEQFLEGEKKEEEEPQENFNINFGDLLYPCFKNNGQFKGFKIRGEVAKKAYLDGQYDIINLKKIVKVCCFMNKMAMNGKESDFKVAEIIKGQEVGAVDIRKFNKHVQ